MHKTAATIVIALLLSAGCGPPPLPPYDYKKEPDPRGTEYVVGVGDHLIISVWRNPDLATEAPVRPDGTITMPLVGDLKAVGRTPTSIRDEIKAKLAAYITDAAAVVTVAVTEVNSYRFTVSGEVVQPGVFTSQSFVTIVDAIAMAGGFTRFARKGGITIARRTAGAPRRIPIDYDAIISGKRPEMNLVLLAGDSVLVP